MNHNPLPFSFSYFSEKVSFFSWAFLGPVNLLPTSLE
jgi:hypothetical protein